MKEHENMLVLIFRNHGERAGTSLMHPHSQMIVTGIVPPLVREREEQAQRYFDEWGRCVFCEMIEFERNDRSRVVFENESFLGFVPFAAEVPFEIWVMPKEHEADFGSINARAKTALAEALHHVLSRLRTKLPDPDYNYVINSSSQYDSGEPHIHWYLQVRPRLVTPAGFELGTGIRINPSLPEHDAAFLNQ
jgi:UDPglucose--hexose-1-phosphate uridylyltransferase